MRKSMVAAFAREPDLAVCGEAEDSPAAFTGIFATRPDVVVTDLALKSTSGIDLISALRERAPALPVVATSMFDVLTSERRALAAGAVGFVAKQDGPDLLVRAVQSALESRRMPAWQAGD